MPQLPDPLLRERDAADYIGVSDYTLQKWRWRGNGPRFVRIGGPHGRAIRYRKRDLDAYIGQNLVATLDQSGGDDE
ncbi:helix-turn-helix transcriptional regulator [Maricaulis sp.]|uniref:helix-turn-helix transcriptional regulator n=1 Tax=Maricaulis sp. TaxID=1486257 RepID=UPI003A9024D2